MKTTERMRESRKPDWPAIVLGLTVTLTLVQALGVIGLATDALRFKPNQALWVLVAKTLYLLAAAAIAAYWGGFSAGYFTGERNRVAAVMNGLLVWELSIISLMLFSWLGSPPFPGLIYRLDDTREGPGALLFTAVLTGIPNLFAAVFGAMHGNERVKAPPQAEKIEEAEERKAA